MPLVHIHMLEGKSDEYIQTLADGIHAALVESWGIPELDRFQIISEHKNKHFLINKAMWDVERSDDVVVIAITSFTRTVEMKKALYKRLVSLLGETINLRADDVFVSIVSNQAEDWTFGCGKAQLCDK